MAPKAQSAGRLAWRLVLLWLPTAGAAVLGAQLRLIFASALIATIGGVLEACVASRLRAAAALRRVPFFLRLLASLCIQAQLCWLLSGQDLSDQLGPASHHSELPQRVPEPAHMQVDVKSISVVLPCANEGEFVAKTVKAVFDATPASLLKEILVVDDASEPPVSADLTDEFLQAHHARILRHDSHQGLIRSKKHGGDAAVGDAIVFLDCHVRPMEDWTTDLLANLRANAKRIVVPVISALDPDTWEETTREGAGRKMCLTWNADFIWCNGYPGPHVPIMSGGLLALTRYWWKETGGYDDQMLSWGGENLDQSLRTWLCGGEIVVAEQSIVAHMWREASNPKTQLRYSIPTDHVRRNRLRACEAWLGPWAAKVRTFPEFEDFGAGGPLEVGNLANIEEFQRKLGCGTFDKYIERFHDLYVGTGRLPESVFHLRDKKSGLCLHLELARDENAWRYIMAPCDRDSEVQRFHAANAKDNGECCSGLKVWDFDTCLTFQGAPSVAVSQACESYSAPERQRIRLSETGALHWDGGEGCLVAADTVPEQKGAVLVASDCTAHVAHTKEAGSFKVVSGGLCLSAAKVVHQEEHFHFVPCADDDPGQVFSSAFRGEDGRVQVRASNGFCLDAGQGKGPFAYHCHQPEQSVANQLFGAEEGAPFTWQPANEPIRCVEPPVQVARLRPCGTKADGHAEAGQRFVKRNEHEDGTFELYQPEVDRCLGQTLQGQYYTAYSAACDGGEGLRWLREEGRLKHVATGLCADGWEPSGVTLFDCASAKDSPTQQFSLAEDGHLQLPRSWADNGRERWPVRCVDTGASEPLQLGGGACEDGAWERLWAEEPMETRLFRSRGGRLS